MRLLQVVKLATYMRPASGLLDDALLVNAIEARATMGFPQKQKSARQPLSGPPALVMRALLQFLNDRVRSVAGHDPTCRPGHDGFMLEPEESEVVDALREVRLDDDVSRNHGARNVRIVGAVVAVCRRLRDRTDPSYIRSAGWPQASVQARPRTKASPPART